MDFSVFQTIGHWAAGNSYSLIFIAMLVEGPVVTAAAAFGAASHLVNGYVIFILSILGNLIPDALYYAFGYWGREKFIDRYGHYIGATKEKMAKTEKMLHENPGKALIAIKLIPLIATPGLVAAGATKMNWKTFAFWSIVVTVPSSLIYFLIGYYSGAAYETIVHYVDVGGYLIIALIAVALFVIWLVRKLSEKWAERLEKQK